MSEKIEIKIEAYYRWLQDQRFAEIERTGISGYCACCGAPNFINAGQTHEGECIWYSSDGGDMASTG